MNVTQSVGIGEIESFLLELGGGNQTDNMQELRQFQTFSLAELTEKEFLGLVFLQNDETQAICPRGQDRTLGAVARRATQLTNPALSPNWNIAGIVAKTQQGLSSSGPRTLVLREARDSELCYGSWYIQDGSHSALGYAIALMTMGTHYSQVTAFLAKGRQPQGAWVK